VNGENSFAALRATDRKRKAIVVCACLSFARTLAGGACLKGIFIPTKLVVRKRTAFFILCSAV
jgi:hypothetical protein